MGLIFKRRISVLGYYLATKSFVSCQESFPNGTLPNKITVRHVIRKFHETGSVCNRRLTEIYESYSLLNVTSVIKTRSM